MAEPTAGAPAAITGNRAGIAFAVAASTSAALLGFLPVLMLTFGLYYLVGAITGEAVAWRSIEMTAVFVGVPAVVSAILLVIPYSLFRAAGSRIGIRRAVVWVAGLLMVGYVGLAAVWAWNATSGFSHANTGDQVWYPIGYGIVALVAGSMVGWRTAAATLIFVAVLGVFLTGIVHGHTPIPAGAEVVHVTISESGVAQVEPATVHAGDVYVVLETPRSQVAFTQDELTGTELPRSGSFNLQGCTDAQRAEDVGQQGFCGNAFKIFLLAGKYVFIGPNGEGPPSPLSRLEVLAVSQVQ